tara:strand:- start:343 stop:624 length:282 start_codon:yes stop_codon:yes gene_type:complete
MKVYRKIILDKNDNVLFEDSYNYEGKWARLGIHYNYKSTRGVKAMEKQAKRERKLAERKAKRQAKEGTKKEPDKSLDTSKPITLDFLTNPDKK